MEKKTELEQFEEIKEALAEIQTDDNMICRICNTPGNLEGKLRITKSKREEYLALPDDSLVQVGHRKYGGSCEITYHKKCLHQYLIKEAWGNWGQVSKEHPWVMYCPVCKFSPSAKHFEQNQIEDFLLCFGLPYINNLSVELGFKPFPDEQDLPAIPSGVSAYEKWQCIVCNEENEATVRKCENCGNDKYSQVN